MRDVQDQDNVGKLARPAIYLQDCGPEVVQLATNYSSDYLDYVENLPFDLQRNVTKLREIDQKCGETLKEMESLYESFMKGNDTAASARRRSYLLQIRRLFGLCKELGDEKISIVQSISEAIESRNKQLELVCKRFKYAYEPTIKTDHGGKREKELKSDSARGNKRSRRQRNNNSAENREKNQGFKDLERAAKFLCYDDTEEPPSKVMLPSASPEHLNTSSSSTPALTRAALRDEDKRISNRSTKDKKDEKFERDENQMTIMTTSGKSVSDSLIPIMSSNIVASPTGGITGGKSKGVAANTSAASKANNKGKKKKRKTCKYQTERQTSNGDVSPIIDIPIDPDEPTYCLCQQVSFGQMIGCDNPKCPIEWFHFSCVRLTHKPKGKWYCPDCTIKRKREGKRTDNR